MRPLARRTHKDRRRRGTKLLPPICPMNRNNKWWTGSMTGIMTFYTVRGTRITRTLPRVRGPGQSCQSPIQVCRRLCDIAEAQRTVYWKLSHSRSGHCKTQYFMVSTANLVKLQKVQNAYFVDLPLPSSFECFTTCYSVSCAECWVKAYNVCAT